MLKPKTLTAFAAILCALAIQSPAPASDSFQTLLNRGYEQLRAGQNQAALHSLGSAVRANPSSMEARRYLAQTLLACGLARRACEQMEIVVKGDPGRAGDLAVLGSACFYMGDCDAAIARHTAALKLDAGLEAAYMGLVNAYLAKGQTERAQQVCARALQTSRDPSSALRFSAKLSEIQQRLAVVVPSGDG